jgi:hypothetical protein
LRVLRCKVWLPAVVVTGAALLAGCSSGDGHVRPDGMVIRQGSSTVVHARGTRVEGQLRVGAGQETAWLRVAFTGRDGNELPTAGYLLEVVSADAAVAEWVQETPGEFGGRVTGHTPGSTVLMVRWMHGPIGLHKDREWPVEVTVTP